MSPLNRTADVVLSCFVLFENLIPPFKLKSEFCFFEAIVVYVSAKICYKQLALKSYNKKECSWGFFPTLFCAYLRKFSNIILLTFH